MKKTLLVSMMIAVSTTFMLPVQAQDSYEQDSSESWRGCYRGARTPVQVRNYDDVAIIAKDGKAPSIQQVEQAIIMAGNGKKWTMKKVVQGKATGKIEATLLVRNKHVVIVEIVYSPNKYSIHYKTSNNMNAAFCNGKTWLHPNYNVWVSQLNNEIQAKIDQL